MIRPWVTSFTSKSIRCSRRVRCCRPIKCCKFVEKCIRPFNLMKKATNGFSNSHAYFMCLSYIGKRFSSRHNKISKLSTSKIGHWISHSSHPHHHVLVQCTQRPVETVELWLSMTWPVCLRLYTNDYTFIDICIFAKFSSIRQSVCRLVILDTRSSLKEMKTK